MRKVNVECAPELVGLKTRAVYRLAVNGPAPMKGSLIENQPTSRSSS
jgi:hypothetical protein